MKRILILGGGFAGLWAAIAAARRRDELGIGPEQVELTLVNRDAYHNIRVRNYETDLSKARIPLDKVLDPIGVKHIEGEVAGVDVAVQNISVIMHGQHRSLSYDRLLLALGSELRRPEKVSGSANLFDVDTYAGARRLGAHLDSLPALPQEPGLFTAVIVGSGTTGIEVATEIPHRLREIAARCGASAAVRVILADHGRQLCPGIGEDARGVIQQALATLGVETRLETSVVSVEQTGVILASGEELPARTVIWCAGMRASPLARLLPIATDRLGRIPTDEFLKVRGVSNVFAAGDIAQAQADGGHSTVMSCQHSRQTGRFAGYNAVSDLLALPMAPLQLAPYVTVMDLGPCGAVYTQGWDRHLLASGEAAKKTKQIINQERIYPPLSGQRKEILAAGTIAGVQAPAVNQTHIQESR